ncbi:MFS general substrate transporter [Xylariomycetidae sp. FL2044]|nr:MFS general substrate transporter [Xylariomycetidae sp. FL2044]
MCLERPKFHLNRSFKYRASRIRTSATCNNHLYLFGLHCVCLLAGKMANIPTSNGAPVPQSEKSAVLPMQPAHARTAGDANKSGNDIPTPGGDSVLDTTAQASPPATRSLKFWAVFFALCLLIISTSLEATIITIALPTIIRSINIGSEYIWVGNAFLLPSIVVQPVIGQLADTFGRRWPLIISTVFFVVGSGVAGGATNAATLIGGRAVQGLGGGAILVLVDVVISDLVSLQDRGKFLGLVRVAGALGSSIGPIVGGAIAQADWRWCFYLNVVTGGLGLVYLVLFLDLKHQPKPWKEALASIDYLGFVTFLGSVTALLLGLVFGGVVFPWNSANTIVPIVVGGVGWLVFHVWESNRLCRNPMVPGRLFATRTSAAGFFLAFDGGMLLFWIIWFLPVYFQGVKGDHPLISGVHQLPFNLFLVPAGIAAGVAISKTGKYRPHHFAGFALVSIGTGLFTLLGPQTNTAAWVFFQIFAAAGLGVNMTAVLPAIQSALEESDVAMVTSMYAFSRNFGGIFGVTIPAVIFNGQVDNLLSRIRSPDAREKLANGKAYGFASMGGVQSLPEDVRREVLGVYTDSLKTVWQLAIAFALAGFLAAFAIQQHDMSRASDTRFGLEEAKTEAPLEDKRPCVPDNL